MVSINDLAQRAAERRGLLEDVLALLTPPVPVRAPGRATAEPVL
jgi:hypothetical protein